MQVAALALFWLHLTIFAWWGFVQAFVRIALRFGLSDPTFPFGVVSLGLIATSLVLIARFARAAKGTAAQDVAKLAVAFATVDLVGESAHFAPQLGLPAVMPQAHSLAELAVLTTWVSCEFGLRCATFVALWRSQQGADRRLGIVFFVLIGVQWLLVLLTFTAATSAFAELSGMPGWALARRGANWLSFSWLPILIVLSRRVARR